MGLVVGVGVGRGVGAGDIVGFRVGVLVGIGLSVGLPEEAGVGGLDGIQEGLKDGEEGSKVAVSKADEFLLLSLENTPPTASPTPRAMAAKAKTVPTTTLREGILSLDQLNENDDTRFVRSVLR